MNSGAGQILSAMRGTCRIKAEDRVLVGVSGGIDSMFLLDQLHRLGQPVTAAVFNHRLRPEADEECEFVREFCAEHGIPCVTGEADVSGYATVNGLGTEAAARELRYRFLFETAVSVGAAAVATAHHANDQAETVLMHILRGSGIDGLSGIRPYALPNAFSQTIPLIRPLLWITRAEIQTAAIESGLNWREDASNTDHSYTRNRLRGDLIPKLEAEYNPEVIKSLCRLAETAAADKNVLDSACEAAIRAVDFKPRQRDLLSPSLNGAEWPREQYQNFQEGLRLRMLRAILSRLDTDLEPGYQNLKEADEFFMTARFNQTRPFMGGLWLKCEGDFAEILKDIKITDWKYPQLSQGWSLSCETREITAAELPEWMDFARKHPEMAVLDADPLVSEPILRTIRPRERFAPYGLDGKSQKLSDFLINAKVPREYRADLAVTADATGIIWIPNLRTSHRCALTESTRRIIIIELTQPE